jgi:hypothetical protein
MHIDYPDVPPSVGRFEAQSFDPVRWRPEYPNPAFDNMRADDAFWAARIVARFSDEAIRAIVRSGQYSDAAAVEVLTDALIKRRERIKEVWLTGINPIVNATLSPAGELRFENAATLYDVGGRPEGYALRWSRFDNTTDTHAAVGEEVVVAETRAFAPSGVLQGSDYVSVRIDTRHRRYPTWLPVQVYFRRTRAGWQTVGLDRGLDAKEAAARPNGRPAPSTRVE